MFDFRFDLNPLKEENLCKETLQTEDQMLGDKDSRISLESLRLSSQPTKSPWPSSDFSARAS